MATAPWGRLPAPFSHPISGTLGELFYCMTADADEWRLSCDYSQRPCDDSERVWSRYVTVSNDPLDLQPALPDRPVVVRPHAPVVILPDRWGRFHVRIPVWARFASRAGSGMRTVAEFASRQLSSTWFGDMQSGELCYAIQSRLLRAVDRTGGPEYAQAEIMVQNSCPEPLKFERICIHAERMTLFQSGSELWANEVKVVYRGADQVSQLNFSRRPPDHVANAVQVCPPRVQPDAHLLSRTFSIIREITGI